QPAEPVADLLALGRIRRPEGRVLGPETSRRIVLLQLRELRVDDRLQPAKAVPLARALAGLDLLRALVQRGEQAFERLGKGFHPLDLELLCDLVQIHPHAGELLQLPVRQLDVLVEAAAYFAVLAERGQRGGWNRVHGIRSDQLLDVVGVGVARVLRRGAGPEASLRPGAGLAEPVPAGTSEQFLVAL